MNLSDLVSDLDKVKSLSPLCFKNYQFLHSLIFLNVKVPSSRSKRRKNDIDTSNIYIFLHTPLVFFFFIFVVNFVIHWNEKALGSHVFPIPIPPPTSQVNNYLSEIHYVKIKKKKNYQFLQLVHLQTSVDSCTEYLNPFSISEQEMYF